MKSIFISIIAVVLFSGCADTTIWENGQKVARMQSNMTNVRLRTPAGTEFSCDSMDNSTPTLAGAEGTSRIIGAGAGAAGVIMTGVVGLQTGNAGAALAATAGTTAIHAAQGVVRPTNINVNSIPTTIVPEGQMIVVQNPNGITQTFRVARVTHRRTHRHRHHVTPNSDQ